VHCDTAVDEDKTYKRGSQSIPGHVSGEKCNSARWYAGSRGADSDCL